MTATTTHGPLNETHDHRLESWVQDADAPGGDFPIQNLPLGRYVSRLNPQPRVGMAIGDQVLDICAVLDHGLLSGDAATGADACQNGSLNELMALPQETASALRLAVSRLLRRGSTHVEQLIGCLVPQQAATLLVPAAVGNYSDFFTSIHHARNSGRISGREVPVQPNFHHLPIAYHGRASTIAPGGTPVVRPSVQYLPEGAGVPVFAPTLKLDFECELAVFVGEGNKAAHRMTLDEARARIFGIALLNDWSARDAQKWESAPLGPFLAKSFLTSVSPWLVTLEALAPFRVGSAAREVEEPVLPYLSDTENLANGGLDIKLRVLLQTRAMRDHGIEHAVISRPNFRDQYWTVFQMLVHQCSNGCLVLPGDILGTGTVSGPSPDQLGCLLELTEGGRKPLSLPGGEERAFLDDGDELVLEGRCERDGFRSIGFGRCAGLVVGAS